MAREISAARRLPARPRGDVPAPQAGPSVWRTSSGSTRSTASRPSGARRHRWRDPRRRRPGLAPSARRIDLVKQRSLGDSAAAGATSATPAWKATSAVATRESPAPDPSSATARCKCPPQQQPPRPSPARRALELQRDLLVRRCAAAASARPPVQVGLPVGRSASARCPAYGPGRAAGQVAERASGWRTWPAR